MKYITAWQVCTSTTRARSNPMISAAYHICLHKHMDIIQNSTSISQLFAWHKRPWGVLWYKFTMDCPPHPSVFPTLETKRIKKSIWKQCDDWATRAHYIMLKNKHHSPLKVQLLSCYEQTGQSQLQKGMVLSVCRLIVSSPFWWLQSRDETSVHINWVQCDWPNL